MIKTSRLDIGRHGINFIHKKIIFNLLCVAKEHVLIFVDYRLKTYLRQF